MASSQSLLSPRKKLRDGRSVWANSSHQSVQIRKPSGQTKAEIVIVGGGISGSLCALELAAAGHDVLVVDRRPPGQGSTMASTAMIQFELDVTFKELCEKIGREKAARAYRRSLKAVADLGKLIKTHGIDAAWRERDALYLAGDETGFRGLEDEARARQAIGLPSIFLTKAQLAERFGIDRTGAILSHGSAELDPIKTSASCLRTAQRLGAAVLSPCEIVEAQPASGGIHLRTASGHTISAKKVVFATGYEVVKGLPRDSFDIISSWAIATQPLPESKLWPSRCLIWEASEPYLYARTTADNRILVGGEDSKLNSSARREAATPAKAQVLVKKMHKLLGRSDLRIEFAWGGAFADSRTGLPVIRKIAELPNAMAILGSGGNGITFSTIAAQLVSKWAAGRHDPDSDLFLGL